MAPNIKYECPICHHTYNSRGDAETCEKRGEAPAPPVGLVFKYWISNSTAIHVGVKEVKYVGHEPAILYFHEGRVPVDWECQRWPVTPDSLQFWAILRQMWTARVRPRVLFDDQICDLIDIWATP